MRPGWPSASRIVATLSLLVVASLPQLAKAQQPWTPELSLEVKRLSDLAYSPDDKQLLYGVQSVDLTGDHYLREYVVSDATGAAPRTLLAPSPHISSAQWSPKGDQVAYLSSERGTNNIWLVGSQGGPGRQITNLEKDVLSFAWAPDGNAIAFVMADPAYKEPVVVNPAVFNKNHLWVLDLKSGTIENLTAGQDFTVSDWAGTWAYDWSPDSARIVFAYQEDPGLDAWTKAQLAIADRASKQVTKVQTGNDHWTYFPKFSPDGRWLAFLNAPGAFKWSFLWDVKMIPAAGGEVVTLADTDNRSPFLWQWSADSKSLYYFENDRATYSFYRLPIDGRPPAKVLGSPGNLNLPGVNGYLVSSFLDLSSDDKTLAFVGQTYDKPPEVYASATADIAPTRVSKVNEAFYDRPTARTELAHWTSLDGTPVEGLLTYPSGYEAGKRYPLAVQIHGGPNGADFNEYLPLIKFFATASYAEGGFFVLRVNYRGTLGYGVRFREDLIGNFGVLDVQDILSGVDHLIEAGMVDPDQLFLIGQSNGGTLTSWIITQTDRFKSACPVAGETDYISLEGTNEYFQTSWYLGGSFIDNLQVFLERSPIFHVKQVSTPTLIQGGLLDENVPHSQLQEFYRALKRVGVDAHLVGYPGSDHDFYPPTLYLRLLRSCLEWTERHRTAGPD